MYVVYILESDQKEQFHTFLLYYIKHYCHFAQKIKNSRAKCCWFQIYCLILLTKCNL